MAERYQSLFRLHENLYCENSPVILSAGLLSKDTKTGNVFIQLKFQNIAKKEIKALNVLIEQFDVTGTKSNENVTFQYLDLTAKANEFFGSKTPINLSNQTTRAFNVYVTDIVYADGTLEKKNYYFSESIPKQNLLENTDGWNKTLIEIYRNKFTGKCKYSVKEYKDLWLCSCGKVNKRFCEQCPECKSLFSELKDFTPEKAESIHKDGIYSSAVADMNSEFQPVIERAIKRFQSIGNWKDAEDKISECEQIIKALNEKRNEERLADEKATKKRKKIIAITTPIVCASIAFVIVLTTVIIQKQKYNNAMALIDSGDYDSAYALLEEIGNSKAIASSKYDRAMALVDFGDYESAYVLLNGLNYKDSDEKLKSIKTKYQQVLFSKAEVGDAVVFGSYEQDNNTSNGKEDIEWVVLAKESNKMLVISDKALDCQQYNTSYTDVTWETCSLRKWLNSTFLNAAFSAEEQAIIQSTTVSADKNPEYSTNPGNTTTDKVFLLSITEVNKYFSSDEGKKCVPTEYAIAHGANTNSYSTKGGAATCRWWLRSPGFSQNFAADIIYDGSVNFGGRNVNFDIGCVRPALWINLE